MSDQITVLDNSNIVESYPGLTLPLTYSFIQVAYRGVFHGLVKENLKNDEVLAKFDDIFANMIANHNGRVYYCINNWYSLLDFLPFSKKITPTWQDMMGVQNTDVYLGQRHKFTVGQKTKLYANILRSAFRVPRDMAQLDRDFQAVKQYFEETYDDALSMEALLDLYDEIVERVLNKWYVTLSNDLYAFIWTGLLKHRLKKKGIDDVAAYISGITSLESLKPVKSLLEIAKAHGDTPDLLHLPAVQEYIALYGDRSPCELKLEVMTYREDPALLEEKIRQYAADPAKLDEMLAKLEKTQQAGRGRILKNARRGIEQRETSRLNRSRIYGMVRRVFLQIGVQLHQKGMIDDPHDVFYLEIDEIRSGNFSNIAQRKADYQAYETMPAHSRLMLRDGEVIDEAMAANIWSGEFTGIGTSTGSITAEAVVLESPNNSIDVKGKIIVTQTTDPGWVFLLTMAGGIVAEKGSLLSHTAIVSRELGIPAVVAVEHATSVIKTGDIIEINGETGRIQVVRSHSIHR